MLNRSNSVKVCCGIAATIGMFWYSPATHASLIGVDSFLIGSTPANGEYTVGDVFGQGPTIAGFQTTGTTTWHNSASLFNVTASGLNHPGVEGELGGAITSVNTNTTSGAEIRRRMVGTTVQATSGNPVYFSYLTRIASPLDITQATSTSFRLRGIDSSGGVPVFGATKFGNDFNFFYASNAGNVANTNIPVVLGEVYQVVVKVSFGANVDYWLFNQNQIPGEAEPVAHFSGTAISNLTTGSGEMRLLAFGAQRIAATYDEVRIGRAWSDVVLPVPEPGSLALLVAGGALMLARRRSMAT
jgi:hypothetical protein